MADYYSILVGAVRGLDPNTPAARRRLYERARSALESADPPIPRWEIKGAQVALDTAIAQVEADSALVALEKTIEHVDPPTLPDKTIDHVEENGRSYRRDQPKPVAPACRIPTRASKPRPLPANQNDRRESQFGIRRLFQWRSTRSIEISEEADAGNDTWLTELLQRASREGDEDYQDFAPKRA